MQKEKLVSPRYRWFKRLQWGVAVSLLLLFALRLWWGWEAQRRLDAAIAKWRAAGEPVLLGDFARPPVPDEENAASFLNEAAKALQLPSGFRDFNEVEAVIESQPDSAPALVSQLMEMNQETLRLIAAARARPAADWNLSLRPPLATTLILPHLKYMRQLARLELAVLIARHEAGDDAGALEACNDTLGIAAALAEGPLISHLVSIAARTLAYDGLERITPTLDIRNDGAENPAVAGPASRAQVNALMEALLDEAEWRRTVVRSMQFERMIQIEDGQIFLKGQGGPFGGPPVASLTLLMLRPAWVLDTAFMAEWTTQMANALAAANWPAAAAHIPARIKRHPFVDNVAHLFSSTLLPSCERAVELSFRTLATRRMAATALAMRLYEIDHGRRPDRLDELAPDYLSSVPRDPYAADDRPIGYAPNASPPVLYCLNVDGVDDGGRFELKIGGGVDGDAADLVFFLNGDRPRRPLAASASGGQSAATQSAPASQSSSVETVPDDHEIDHTERDEGR